MSEEYGELGVDKERLREVGIELDKSKRSGTYLQEDQEAKTFASFFEGVEVMSIQEAMKKYEWVKDYFWKILRRDQDEYTKEADTADVNGYFIRALPDAKVEIPVEACLYLKKAGKQRVHNIVIAEENSELNIISGCTSHPGVAGMHIGLSEFYVKKNAKLSFTMIHSWEPTVEVRPRTAIHIDEGGEFHQQLHSAEPCKARSNLPHCLC